MEISKELFEKAKTAKTAEELLALAKAEGVELSAEEAKKAYAELHKTGELSDDELDNVAGGCGTSGVKCPTCGSTNVECYTSSLDLSSVREYVCNDCKSYFVVRGGM